MRDPYKVVRAMLAEGCVDWTARIICQLLWLLFVLGSCLSAFIKRCSCSLVFQLSCRCLDHLVQLLIVSVILLISLDSCSCSSTSDKLFSLIKRETVLIPRVASLSSDWILLHLLMTSQQLRLRGCHTQQDKIIVGNRLKARNHRCCH